MPLARSSRPHRSCCRFQTKAPNKKPVPCLDQSPPGGGGETGVRGVRGVAASAGGGAASGARRVPSVGPPPLQAFAASHRAHTAAMATFYDIIEHVKAHPELWKGNVRNRTYLRDTWTDVAKTLEMDGE